MNKRYKNIIKTFVSSLSLSFPFILSSCSINSGNNFYNNIDLYKLPTYSNTATANYNVTPNPQNKSENYENINNLKFISERTFSLKMVSKPNSSGARSIGYGTGWLFAKDMSSKANQLTYYLATNLHVGAILFNSNKVSYEYNQSSNNYQLEKNLIFDEIQFGQVITNLNENYSNYEIGTTETKLEVAETYYTQKVDKSAIEFSYLTFDMFNSMQLEDRYKIYNESIIKNATQDLAILKIDFSKRKYIDYPISPLKNKDPILKALNAYDANPTRFANKQEYSDDLLDLNNKNSKIIVGGFPFVKTYEQKNSSGGAWTTSNSLQNVLYSNTEAGISFNKSDWKKGIYSNDMDFIKKYYVINGNIPFITNDYASYTNTSLQFLFENLNLSGGSSGSMAINEKNEVVGIYWGTYYRIDGLIGRTFGAIDSFINDGDKQDKSGLTVKKYNTISDFVSKVNNTNLKNN